MDEDRMTAPPNTLGSEAGAGRIAAAWRGGVEAILETGRDLSLAKEELPHGEIKAMVERELPFKASTGGIGDIRGVAIYRRTAGT